MQPQQSTLVDEEADAADRRDRRSAVIVSVFGAVGVAVSGALLIFGDAGL